VDFGQRVRDSRQLWRPSLVDAGNPVIGDQQSYQLVQTPMSFLSAPAGSATRTSSPFGDFVHVTARGVRDAIASNLDPFSPGPFTAQSPAYDIGLSSAFEATAGTQFPAVAGEGDKYAFFLGIAAAAFDLAYQRIWGND
jgi:hypothetical protein